MKKNSVVLFVLWVAVANQAWAEPSDKEVRFQNEIDGLRAILQTSEIIQTQALLDKNPSAFKVTLEKKGSAKKPEWDLYCTDTVGNLRCLEFPLEFYLNNGGAKYKGNRIVLDPAMSFLTYKGGSGNKADDLQKEAIRLREEQEALAKAQGKKAEEIALNNILFGVVGFLLLVAIGAVSVGARRGIRSARKDLSGKTYQEYEKRFDQKVIEAEASITKAAKEAVEAATVPASTDRAHVFSLTEAVQSLKKDVEHLKQCVTTDRTQLHSLAEKFEHVEDSKATVETASTKNGTTFNYVSKEAYANPLDVPVYEPAPPSQDTGQLDDTIVDNQRRALPGPDVDKAVEDAAKFRNLVDKIGDDQDSDDITAPFSQQLEKVAT